MSQTAAPTGCRVRTGEDNRSGPIDLQGWRGRAPPHLLPEPRRHPAPRGGEGQAGTANEESGLAPFPALFHLPGAWVVLAPSKRAIRPSGPPRPGGRGGCGRSADAVGAGRDVEVRGAVSVPDSRPDWVPGPYGRGQPFGTKRRSGMARPRPAPPPPRASEAPRPPGRGGPSRHGERGERPRSLSRALLPPRRVGCPGPFETSDSPFWPSPPWGAGWLRTLCGRSRGGARR